MTFVVQISIAKSKLENPHTLQMINAVKLFGFQSAKICATKYTPGQLQSYNCLLSLTF